MRKIILPIIVFLFLFSAANIHAQNLGGVANIVYLQSQKTQISNPETLQSFYDNLKGQPRDYFINSSSDFELYLNLLVPDPANKDGRYSADVFDNQGNKIYSVDGTSANWQEFYDPSVREYYLKGPDLDQKLLAGKYKIEVYSKDNQGEYVLAVGKKETRDIKSISNLYWQIPLLKVTFFKTSVLQFFLTRIGIIGVGVFGVLLILLFILYYLVGLVREAIRHRRAKTLLLTSAGMQMKDEIVKLLQKPAYDITVGFITTAYKYKLEENPDYVNRDLETMKEIGFNVEEIDIEGKKEHEVMKLLELKDIIFVEGGNTFYLLKAMRGCNFEKVIRKLLKLGKVYIGASAGSVVAGRTIKSSNKFGTGDKNNFGVKNLKGLNLVPFDIVVHYTPENAEIIKKKLRWKWQRRKLKILTDDQAILVQGKEVDLIGKGEAIII